MSAPLHATARPHPGYHADIEEAKTRTRRRMAEHEAIRAGTTPAAPKRWRGTWWTLQPITWRWVRIAALSLVFVGIAVEFSAPTSAVQAGIFCAVIVGEFVLIGHAFGGWDGPRWHRRRG